MKYSKLLDQLPWRVEKDSPSPRDQQLLVRAHSHARYELSFNRELFGDTEWCLVEDVVALLISDGIHTGPAFVPPPGEFSGCRCLDCPEKPAQSNGK
jgi:hypothetical protein